MSKNISKKAVSNALLLSGGGTRGFAHLGVLEVLEDEGFKPDFIVGSSVGALVGVCYAAGKPLDEIVSHFLEIPLYKLLRPNFNGGLLGTEKIVDAVLSFAQVTSFSQLSIPLVVNATDINNGDDVSFSSGKLKPALQASIAVPGLFSPVVIGSRVFVDGGSSHPLPIHLLPKAKHTFIVDITFKFEKITEKSSPLKVLQNALFALQKQGLSKLKKGMIYIKPPLEEFSHYEYVTSARRTMLLRGRKAAREALHTLEK
ncbi:MAG: patatin-like phospholipase family protein [Nanoarchaeota archaeon]|nr:patatin-like phospholipase family protein [Nanoarchaeota archaeon]